MLLQLQQPGSKGGGRGGAGAGAGGAGAGAVGALSVDEELEPLLDLMAEMALLLDRPYDAIQLLGQIIPSGAGGGGGGGGGGASKASSRDAPPPAPPLRLSMLAAAWQCAGQLRAAAHVSSRALASLPKLPLESAAATCLFWLRRGHLLCALHRPVHAADAYAAADAAPDSLAAREGLLWSRHLSGADAEGALGGGGGALVGVAAAAGGGGGGKGGGDGGAMGLGGPADTHADHTLADAYAALVAEWPAVGVRARLHRAHLMWRRGELRRADAELGDAVKLAVEADAPTSRAGCLAMRALVNARARQHGAAMACVNNCSEVVVVVEEEEEEEAPPPLPPPPRCRRRCRRWCFKSCTTFVGPASTSRVIQIARVAL